MSLFSKKDFTNAKWYILEKVCQLMIGIYITPKIFNSLGAFNSGELEISKAIVGVLAPFFFLGLSAICIRELVFKPKLKNYILGTTLVLRLASFLILSLCLLIYTYFTNTTEITFIVLILAFSYLFRISDVIECFFVATKEYKYVFFCKIITLVIVLIVQYYGVENNLGAFYFASILFFEFAIQTIIYLVIIRYSKQLDLSKLKWSFAIAKDLLKSAFPLLLTNFIIVFYLAIDDFFINNYLGNAANGVFSVVGFLVIFITWNIGAAFIYGLYPALAECYLIDKKLYASRLKFMIIVVMIFGISIGLFYTFFGDYIISTQYDKSFSTAKLPLQIFGWAPLFIFMGMLFEKHLVNQNQLDRNVYRFILGCCVNALFCFLLIPKYKLVGAAFAVLLSHFITNIVFVFLYKSYRNNIWALLFSKTK
ncbi:polysaccharide biosynthesis C-terminal domain-containing protein [Algibacter sp. L4_22]|uniref:polysaccharide biosynthesis C-terminal domain-containing protein n=1 Tax=Algibacter sp. L4_22 TaxID=2942477 RepID=UPI00201B46C1|nr:polysaccharide biosynthesis C-terminal domain-containing protein [Algibacter sp. L4_22]